MGQVKVKLSKNSWADLQILFFALALLLFILVQISQGNDEVNSPDKTVMQSWEPVPGAANYSPSIAPYPKETSGDHQATGTLVF